MPTPVIIVLAVGCVGSIAFMWYLFATAPLSDCANEECGAPDCPGCGPPVPSPEDIEARLRRHGF